MQNVSNINETNTDTRSKAVEISQRYIKADRDGQRTALEYMTDFDKMAKKAASKHMRQVNKALETGDLDQLEKLVKQAEAFGIKL